MRLSGKKGFTLVELMVALLLFAIVMTAGSQLLTVGQSAWTQTDTEIRLVEDLRIILLRLSNELQESGTDKDGVFQVAILDDTGNNGSDVLRFAVPICACGMSVIDENGDVAAWGAPLTWGEAGCGTDYPVGNNGKVDICHLPPGNPGNENNLSVSVNAVSAHLAHGDRLGDCNDCDPDSYTNRTIEYLLDTDGTLVRRVLDASDNPLNSVVFAHNLTGFQVSVNSDQTVVTIVIQMSLNTAMNRTVTRNATIDVILRN